MSRLPQRIVCLSTETVELLYLLGEQERIAGISGFTVRPPRARKEKPKVSAFSSGKPERILAVQPDLVLAFSDLQADICRELIKAGVEVHVFNQRSVDGILTMVDRVGRLVGAEARSSALLASLEAGLAAARARATQRITRHGRPLRVYFEEWDAPMISGIQWVSELLTLAGAEDIFAERASAPEAAGRIIADPAEVLARRPDLIIGSWCGKHFRPEQVAARPGWEALPAVRHGRIHEIKSPIILSPGVGALTEGLAAIEALLDGVDGPLD